MEKDAFDNYAKTHRYRNFYQSSAYGDLMSEYGFNAHYLGFVDNSNELIGATLILYKDIFLGFKYAYAPRGYLIDYTNSNLIIELTSKIKKLLFKQKFIYIKIDPLIPCSTRDEQGNILSYNSEINNILEILKKANYVHKGFNQYFENMKPRWNAYLNFTTNNNNLFKEFSKQIRTKIRKAERNGIEIYLGNKEDIPKFYEFIKKKHRRPLSYYQTLFNTFPPDMVELYFARVNSEKYVINAKNQYETETIRNEELNQAIQNANGKDIRKILNEKMESDKLLTAYKTELLTATKLLQLHPEGVTVGAICIIKYDQGINLLIDGYNPTYSRFNSNYLLKWYLIKKYNNLGYQYFNLNAITGEFNKPNKYSGLNESKLGFGATATEYIGEFDYIINHLMYKICEFKPIRKSIQKKVG